LAIFFGSDHLPL
jgi:serine/threonine protein kinase